MERVKVALPVFEGDDTIFILRVLQCQSHFSFDPHRVDCVRRKEDGEPVAALERTEDFILPLLGSQHISRTEKYRDSVSGQDLGQTLSHRSVFVCVGEKYLGRQHHSRSKGTHFLNHVLPVFFAISNPDGIQVAQYPGGISGEFGAQKHGKQAAFIMPCRQSVLNFLFEPL